MPTAPGDAVETANIVHEAVPGDDHAVATVKLTKGGENTPAKWV